MREVVAPTRKQSPLAALVVATVAMLLAVSSSAMFLQAQVAAGPCPHFESRRAAGPAEHPAESIHESPAPAPKLCKTKHDGPEPLGQPIVVYELCPPEPSDDHGPRPAAARPR